MHSSIMTSHWLALALIAYAAIAQETGEQHWKEYSFPEDGFAVSAPSPIRVSPLSAGTRIYDLHLKGNVGFHLFPKNESGDERLLLAFVRTEMTRNPGFIKGSDKDISISGHPGVQYESIKACRGCGSVSTLHVLARVYAVGHKGFFLDVVYPEAPAPPPEAERLMDSFRILRP